MRILDLACGGGRDLKAFRERNCNVTGLDGSATLCLLASACCPEAEIEHADMATMELPAETYDGVYCNAGLMHLPIELLPATFVAGPTLPSGSFRGDMLSRRRIISRRALEEEARSLTSRPRGGSSPTRLDDQAGEDSRVAGPGRMFLRVHRPRRRQGRRRLDQGTVHVRAHVAQLPEREYVGPDGLGRRRRSGSTRGPLFVWSGFEWSWAIQKERVVRREDKRERERQTSLPRRSRTLRRTRYVLLRVTTLADAP